MRKMVRFPSRLFWTLGIGALAVAPPAIAVDTPFSEIGVYDRAAWSRSVTECDRRASHPNDPERVAKGLDREEIDLKAAIRACRAALKKDPDNPRLNYQMARVHGYSGRHEEGDPYRVRALQAGYPQSLFVVGYIRLEDWDGRGKDVCYGGELIRRSAKAGRFAGLVGFTHYALNGVFEACAHHPVVERSELEAFIAEADASANDYYQRLLVTELKRRLENEGKPLSHR